MKKSIFLIFAAILCAMSVSAKTIYLKPNSNWAGNSPRNAAYFFDGNGSEIWVGMTDTDGDGIYECEAPDGYPNVIFCSMNKNTTALGWGDKWNQSADLTIPTNDQNLCTLASDWNYPNGTWSVYDPLAIDVYLAGGMNGWNATADQFKLTEAGSSIAELKKTIEADDYEIKIVVGGKWYTNTTGDITRDANTLTVNEDNPRNIPFKADKSGEYTFQWSINDNKLTVIYPEEEVVITHTYTVAGTESVFGTNWDATNTANDMVEQTNGTYKLEKTNVLAENGSTIQLKVCVDHAWTTSYPENNYELSITETAYYTITVTFDPSDNSVEATATKTADYEGEAITHTYTVAGSAALCGVEWDYTATANDMTTSDDVTYTWTKSDVEVTGNLEFKVFEDHSNSVTYPNNNWVINPENYDGVAVYTVTITFNASSKEVTVSMTKTGNVTPVTHTYTVAGTESVFGSNWDVTDTANDMVEQTDGTYKLEKTNVLAESGTTIKLKVCVDHAWDISYPENDYELSITETAYYTITVTFDPSDNSVEATATKTADYEGEAITHTYTVAGSAALCGVEWDYAATANDMTTADNVSYTWSKTGVEVKGNLEFKVFEDHSNSTAYPSNNWVINPADYEGAAVYTVTITFNAETKEITVAMEKTGDVTPPVISYVLMGVNGDWTNGIPLTVNPDNADEYILTDQVIIKATDAIKVVTLTDGQATAWCGTVDSYSNATHTADGSGNIVLEDGIYTFYFKKTANNIYINQTGYARNVTNKYGTICLPYASASTAGATFFEVVGQESGNVYLASVTELEAGVPYIFEKSANQIKVVYTGEKETTAGSANGLVGTFADNTTVPNNAYILYGGAFCTNNDPTKPNKINAYRAYLNLSAVEGGAPTQKMPGRRYIGMSVQGENETTGVEDIFTTDAPVKVIENGQLIIIRDGVKYNVQGQKLQ